MNIGELGVNTYTESDTVEKLDLGDHEYDGIETKEQMRALRRAYDSILVRRGEITLADFKEKKRR